MTVGRKPKPTALRLIAGNPGKRPLPKKEAVVALAEPTPPAFLCDDAKVEWGRVSHMLYALRLLSNADVAALSAYCESWALFKQAKEALNLMAKTDQVTKGLLIKTSNGNAIQNPLVGIANKAAADMVRYAAEFGMTPSARARIHAEGKEVGASQDKSDRYFA